MRDKIFHARALLTAGALAFLLVLGAHAQVQTSPSGTPKTPPALGTIKTITPTLLVLVTDAGAEVRVQLTPDVKVVRVPPGSKDLKEATPIQLTDLQTGDRILVRMKPGDDASSLFATSIIAMKKADISDLQSKEREEWQRHGIGGLVKSVDAASGAITIGTLAATGSKDIVVRTDKDTVLRRYAPGSVKFDDAKTAPITEIHSGDQLRARGTRNADGSEFTAAEIVSGSFRNIGGTVTGVDAGSGTLTVNDIATKKPVELKITSDSQMRKLPPEMSQRIAARLKGATGGASAGGAAPGASGPSTAGNPPASGQAASNPGGTPGPGAGGPRGAGGGGGDIQTLLSRLPTSGLGDFQKGDVVMVVATAGQGAGQATVITLLGGVEPILQSSTQGQAASILTPWTLGQGGAGADAGTP
jgi:hypothetical protein